MSFLQYPDAMNAPSELQVWDNAAFDSEEAPTKASWSSLSLHPVFETHSESLDSDRSKENLSPGIVNSPVSVKSSIPIKPLHSHGVLGNSQRNPTKIPVKNGGFVAHLSPMNKKEDERKIDSEIEEIENEIKRLSCRLEALRLEKAERDAKTTIEKKGRIVPAKFMESKPSVKIEENQNPPSSKSKINRRGMSLGPAEIFVGSRFRPPGKLDTTPGPATQSRRKSCFWKLQDIDKSKSAITERRKSMTVSPKLRKTASKIEAQKQAASTTVGSKKLAKKESSSSGVLSLIQPRKLFKDGEKEKSASTKKPLKPGRVIASRYNQIPSNQSSGNSSAAIEAARKRSLPESEKEDGGKKARGGAESARSKKRWEVPSEIVVYKSNKEEEDGKEKEKPLMESMDLLPKIKTTRFVDESPRGSGPAKRVSELRGKKRSFFCPDEDEDADGVVAASACEALSFAEEEEEADGNGNGSF